MFVVNLGVWLIYWSFFRLVSSPAQCHKKFKTASQSHHNIDWMVFIISHVLECCYCVYQVYKMLDFWGILFVNHSWRIPTTKSQCLLFKIKTFSALQDHKSRSVQFRTCVKYVKLYASCELHRPAFMTLEPIRFC